MDGGRPLDRGVLDRVRATLRRALDRDDLPDIPTLCAEEVDRACAPWGLLAEDKQATLVAGIEVAVELAPLRESATPRYDLARQIQARLRKEAYVLHARRYLADGGPLHPRQRQVIEDLAAFARPYTSRLWAGCTDATSGRTPVTTSTTSEPCWRGWPGRSASTTGSESRRCWKAATGTMAGGGQ